MTSRLNGQLAMVVSHGRNTVAVVSIAAANGLIQRIFIQNDRGKLVSSARNAIEERRGNESTAFIADFPEGASASFRSLAISVQTRRQCSDDGRIHAEKTQNPR